MKHYEARLQADLNLIRDRVGALAEGVRGAVERAVQGVIARDVDAMYDVILGDGAFNRETRGIDTACHAFVARHVPAAGHLRFVSSVLRMTISIERIGDYAVTMSRVGVHLDEDLSEEVVNNLSSLADQVSQMLGVATRAFLVGDPDLAKQTKKLAKAIDVTHDRILVEALQGRTGQSMRDVARLMTVFDKLERVSDQAKNICEEVVFITTGETKVSKHYQVLFLDKDGTFMAPLAAALAGRAFPESGTYICASLNPGDAYAPLLGELSDLVSMNMPSDGPEALAPLAPSPAKYHVIVTVNLDAAARPRIPFHSILQKWTIDEPQDLAGARQAVNELSAHIQSLMEALRGPDAS